MKTKLYSILVLILALGFFGCGNQISGTISEMESLVEKVEKDKTKFSKEEWENMDKQMSAYLNELNIALENKKLGTFDAIKISTASLRYVAARAESSVELKEFVTEMEKTSKELEKATENLEKITE